MAKSMTKKSRPERPAPAPTTTEPARAIEGRVIALAETVATMAGTVHGKADALLDRRALQKQLSHVRERASALLAYLGRRKPRRATRRSSAGGRSGGVVDAPGKKHRKAPPQQRGVAHSDESVAKLVQARTRRPPRRG